MFTSKWTTVWQHGIIHALLNTYLPSCASPTAMQDGRPSLQTGTSHNGDHTEFSG